ncbi:DUF192 domain-containing protein [Agrobacterium rubi]|nr:DUF192 domain-containing protein [Agrobacterium rubi]NTF24555.1 DUF192 domain-containing protein [Agrobacterium rubi]
MLLRTFAIVFFSCTSLLGLTLVAEPSVGAPQQELKRADLIVETQRGGVRISAEVAVTPVEQEIGLKGRERHLGVAGMYFPQTKPEIVEVSTEGNRFPVDVVFVGEDGAIARIDPGISRPSGIIRSPGQISAYLQVAAGAASKLGLREGDRIRPDLEG